MVGQLNTYERDTHMSTHPPRTHPPRRLRTAVTGALCAALAVLGLALSPTQAPEPAPGAELVPYYAGA